ncbi:DUF4446 family protein [Candidatus Daviesbacteria bacterium]|nr:DUF4446 family protein [Candidatus Daviesbacteria bacterium]
MYPDGVWVFFALVILVWLCIITYLVLGEKKFLKELFPKSGSRDIRKKFEEVLSGVEELSSRLLESNKKIKELELKGLEHIQRVELMRYNPYDDAGGDQSFSIAILDGDGTGVVLTSLHARSGTRVYSKPVLKGKPENYQFSKEEEIVVKKAMKMK